MNAKHVLIGAVTLVFIALTSGWLWNLNESVGDYREADLFAQELADATYELEKLDRESLCHILDSWEDTPTEAEVDLHPDELIWFEVNATYRIGVANDGRILWMNQGVRSE